MKKIITLLAIASTTTFGLFAFMAFLISNDQVAPIVATDTVVIDVFKTPEDSKIEHIIRPKFVAPEPPKTMPRTNMVPDEVSVDTSFTYQPTAIDLGNTGSGLGTLKNAPDRDARPIVQINPKYPVSAARDGIQGWVLLAFDIDPLGGVVNVNVLDSAPKRVFDKAAKQALRKWKYRAKLVNGLAVTQERLTVQLDFNMDS